jgi:hypothetical protein
VDTQGGVNKDVWKASDARGAFVAIDFEELPDDPELAFAQIAKACESDLLDRVHPDNFERHYHDCLEFFTTVTAAAKALELPILADWKFLSYDQDFHNDFIRFLSDVRHYVKVIEIRSARSISAFSVRLNQHEKNTIRSHIEKIRQIVGHFQKLLRYLAVS